MAESRGFIPCNSAVVKRLIEAGIIPPECTSFELILRPSEPVRIKIERHVFPEELEILAEALEKNPDEAADIVREVLFRDRNDPKGGGTVSAKVFGK